MARKKKVKLNDNNLAIAYYRFSSHSQNEVSIEQQRELAHEWADAHGFHIIREYEYAVISGSTDARLGFQSMLSEVAKIRLHLHVIFGHYPQFYVGKRGEHAEGFGFREVLVL